MLMFIPACYGLATRVARIDESFKSYCEYSKEHEATQNEHIGRNTAAVTEHGQRITKLEP